MDAAGAGGGLSSGKARAGRPTSRMRGKGGGGSALMLASMLDILMSILFFLLKNYSAVLSDFTMGKDIVLPSSIAKIPPAAHLNLQVTQRAIILDDKEIVSIINGDVDRRDLYRDGVTIVRLAQALKAQKDKSQLIQSKSGEVQKGEQSFTGTIVMQADKNLKFSLLKKVIYTAGITDFVMLKLAVLKKEDG